MFLFYIAGITDNDSKPSEWIHNHKSVAVVISWIAGEQARVSDLTMGTMADTLILAIAGGALNTIMLIWGYQMSYRQLINIPQVKIEIIQSLAGSIGIVLTVPATAQFSVILFKNKKSLT